MSLAAAAPLIADKIERGQVGVVFGREDDGLTNTDISLLDAVVTIPASEKFPSLNLAQAVIVSCYEIFNSIRRKSKAEDSQEIRGRPPRQEPIYASKEEILGLLARLGKTLARLEYKDSKGHALKTKIVNQFGKLFGRAGMLAKDIKMFEGLLERIDEKTGSKN
jgi:tRNA/rRNA methyltransferase